MRAVLLLLVVSLLTIKTVVGGKNKKERNKPSQYGSECTDWRYGNCVPSNGDCGAGLREGSCDQQTKKMKCKVPCNWKKDFGEKKRKDKGNQTWGVEKSLQDQTKVFRVREQAETIIVS
ncbi:midkine-B isoform X2 [Lates calcarifer]|uniref:Midkine n=1 Tax=Lates calcarifer TaxID=8187 RepID=A0AAJ8AYH3_LATCA|nr:midkine-B isoform X2 [Lates calcarifer]